MNPHTGPRSPEGKAASSRNATRHGLTAHQPVVTQADQPLFDAMRNQLFHTLNPSSFLEDLTFQRILIASWNMHRVLQLEQGLLAKSEGQDPLSHPDTRKDAELYHRYYLRFESSYRSGLRELEKLQRLHIFHAIHFGEAEQVPLTALHDLQQIQQFAKRNAAAAPPVENIDAKAAFHATRETEIAQKLAQRREELLKEQR
jgi:hypothetical protein